MSQKLEQAFRTALKNEEAPFDPKAWEAMEARLDKAMPIKGIKANNYWLAASVVALVGAGLYFMNSPEKRTKNENSTTEQTISTSETIDNRVESKNLTAKKNTLVPQERVEATKNKPSEKLDAKNTETNVSNDSEPSINSNFNSPTEKPNPTEQENTTDFETIERIVLPKIGRSCQNDIIIINNPNKSNIILVEPNGRELIIAPRATVNAKLAATGSYVIKGSVLGTPVEKFNVSPSPISDIEVDYYTIFDKGVPTLNAKAEGNEAEFVWNLKGTNQTFSGREIELHLFRKGNYELELSAKSLSGCQTVISKTINVKENYNLMAMNAFNPLDNDIRNTAFMPYALKERNTKFELLIIDPKDGGIVYKTNDASMGWDGIDRRTGKLASSGANFIWKATIAKPLKGESSDYSGTVVVAM